MLEVEVLRLLLVCTLVAGKQSQSKLLSLGLARWGGYAVGT